MNGSLGLTGFDFIVIGIFVLFVARGLWIGFLRQVTTIVALVVGYVIAGQYHDRLFPFLRDLSENPHAVFWASYVLLFVLTYVVCMLLGKGLAKVVELTIAGWFDKLLGGLLGVVKGGVLIILLHMLLSSVLAPENNMLRESFLSVYIGQGTKMFRSIIKDENIRKKFVQQMPAIREKEPPRGADGVRPFVPAPSQEDSSPPVK